MLRFILRRETLDQHSGMRRDDHETMDLEIPDLEAMLTRGGFGNGGFDQTILVGIEVLPKAQEAGQ